MNLSIDEILERFELLVDASALALLHSKDYKDLIPLILAKTKIHVSNITLIDFLTYLYYVKKINSQTPILQLLRQIYNIVDINDKIITKAALIKSDLLHHSYQFNDADVINVAIALEKGYILITADPSDYEIYKKYGLVVVSVEEVATRIKEIVISEGGK